MSISSFRQKLLGGLKLDRYQTHKNTALILADASKCRTESERRLRFTRTDLSLRSHHPKQTELQELRTKEKQNV